VDIRALRASFSREAREDIKSSRFTKDSVVS
ncbi:uncharacterized protein METZ01_LOCUS31869, partial [marine metagenome]